MKTATVHSSHGDITIDAETGKVLTVDAWCEAPCEYCITDYAGATFDIARYIKTYGKAEDEYDILNLGCTFADGHYETPEIKLDQLDRYMEDNSFCPFCGGALEGNGMFEINGKRISQEVSCAKCDSRFRDSYILKSVECIG